VPNYDGFSGKFALKLIASWVALGLRRPDMGLAQIPQSTFDGD